MTKSTRKLIGTALLIALVIVYALLAMAVAEGRIRDLPTVAQTLAYIALGLLWVLPAMPLIRWMERPDAGQ